MKKTYLLAFTAIFFWSTVSVAAKLLLGSYDNFQVLWVSSFFAAIFLLILNIITGKLKILKTYKPRDYLISVLIGLPGSLLYYLFFYAGADRMPASQAFIVNYLWPIMSVVFACIILKEKLTLRKGIAIVVSFFGIVIVMGGDLARLDSQILSGAVLCVLGAVSYGLFTALNQKFSYDKCICMMLNCLVTFLLTTVINGLNGNLFIPSAVESLGFVWNGVFTIGIANTVWQIALESGKTAQVSNLAYITPFISLIWTSLILKEELHINVLAGLIVIVLGIFIQLRDKTSGEAVSNKQ